jgi:hypothetical protein
MIKTPKHSHLKALDISLASPEPGDGLHTLALLIHSEVGGALLAQIGKDVGREQFTKCFQGKDYPLPETTLRVSLPMYIERKVLRGSVLRDFERNLMAIKSSERKTWLAGSLRCNYPMRRLMSFLKNRYHDSGRNPYLEIQTQSAFESELNSVFN